MILDDYEGFEIEECLKIFRRDEEEERKKLNERGIKYQLASRLENIRFYFIFFNLAFVE